MKKSLIVFSTLFVLLLSGCYRFPDPTPEISSSDTKNQKTLAKLSELKKACLEKDSVACYKLGDFYRTSACNKTKNFPYDKFKYKDTPGFDYYKAHSYYSQACWLGYSPGCIKRAEHYLRNVPLGKSYASYHHARRALIDACDFYKDVEGCEALCSYYLHRDVDHPKAKKYCRKSCNLGGGISCKNLDLLLYRGQGDIRKDPPESIEYYNRICRLNDAYGCMKLGHMYREGKGISQDYFKARDYYSKACNLNHTNGCVQLGVLYREGKGVKQDYSKAMKYFSDSCNLNNMVGCQYYRVTKEKGSEYFMKRAN